MVEVHLLSQSRPITYNNVINTYTKGDMFCLYLEGEMVHKYPSINIFRVVENYNRGGADE